MIGVGELEDFDFKDEIAERPRMTLMKSRASVPRDYLHISTLQAIDNNEGTTFKHNTKYQTNQKLNKKM